VIEADLAIVGLGSVGAMAAWHATRRPGLRVVGFDRFPTGHGRGASAGESRLFRTAYHEAPDYVPLLLEARRAWLDLERHAQRDLFIPTGTLSIGLRDGAPLSNVLASVTEHALPHRVLDAAALAAAYPQHAIGPDDIGVLDELGGALRPESAIAAALGIARDDGLEIRGRSQVIRLVESADSVEIHTDDGTVVRARHVIASAGPWTAELLPQLSPQLVVKPLVLTWFQADDIRRYLPDVFPVFVRDTADFHIFGAPSLDGYSVKVSVNDRWGTVATADDVPRWLDDATLAFLGPKVHELLPGLSPEPVRHSVHMDAYAPDRRALLGALPGSTRITVVAGLSGHGFKLAPIFGELAVALALDGGTEADLSRFSPARTELTP
jgi:sarcosine oxidase